MTLQSETNKQNPFDVFEQLLVLDYVRPNQVIPAFLEMDHHNGIYSTLSNANQQVAASVCGASMDCSGCGLRVAFPPRIVFPE